MNYLKYIEHSAENLQFFLWLRAYTQRFNDLPEHERKLSPEWTLSEYETEQMAAQSETRKMKVGADTAAMMKGTGLESGQTVTESEKISDPFNTPPRTPSTEWNRDHGTTSEFGSDEKSNWSSTQKTVDVRRKAEGSYDDAGLKWQPCEFIILEAINVTPTNENRSHNPTIPRRDRPNHHHLHRPRRSSPTQSLRQGAKCSPARPREHHSPLCVPICSNQCRMVSTLPSSPQLRPLDYLQRQPSPCHLRPRSWYRWHSRRPAC